MNKKFNLIVYSTLAFLALSTVTAVYAVRYQYEYLGPPAIYLGPGWCTFSSVKYPYAISVKINTIVDGNGNPTTAHIIIEDQTTHTFLWEGDKGAGQSTPTKNAYNHKIQVHIQCPDNRPIGFYYTATITWIFTEG